MGFVNPAYCDVRFGLLQEVQLQTLHTAYILLPVPLTTCVHLPLLSLFSIFDMCVYLPSPRFLTSCPRPHSTHERPCSAQDDVYETKDDIARTIKYALSKIMSDYGYSIMHVLVNDILPATKVGDRRQVQQACKVGRILLRKRMLDSSIPKFLPIFIFEA